jgi:uncharacterized protein YdhG (YjbR/CyaY superfamily)
MNPDNIPKTIDEYIAAQPPDVRKKLIDMRVTIKKAAPNAEEKISYRMPAFALKGMLVYFGAHTNHLGFYPFTSAMKEFGKELSAFRTSKGGVQFPYKDPLPLNLIHKIIEFRVKENLLKEEAKLARKKTKK